MLHIVEVPVCFHRSSSISSSIMQVQQHDGLGWTEFGLFCNGACDVQLTSFEHILLCLHSLAHGWHIVGVICSENFHYMHI